MSLSNIKGSRWEINGWMVDNDLQRSSLDRLNGLDAMQWWVILLPLLLVIIWTVSMNTTCTMWTLFISGEHCKHKSQFLGWFKSLFIQLIWQKLLMATFCSVSAPVSVWFHQLHHPPEIRCQHQHQHQPHHQAYRRHKNFISLYQLFCINRAPHHQQAVCDFTI